MDVCSLIFLGLAIGALVAFSFTIWASWLSSRESLLVKRLEKENSELKKEILCLEHDIDSFEKENFKLTQLISKNNFKILNNLEASLDKLFSIDLDFDSFDKKKGKVKSNDIIF